MREQTIRIYKFDELTDDAKETAREWYRNGIGGEYFFWDDAKESINAFCDHFGASIKNYSIGAFENSWIDTDATKENFRGIKLKSIKRDAMPTGYFLDCAIWQTFYDEFKRTGNALYAFGYAIDIATKEVRNDIEYQYSDEYIDEMLTINEYEFTENGMIY